jgi:hypothetical protein
MQTVAIPQHSLFLQPVLRPEFQTELLWMSGPYQFANVLLLPRTAGQPQGADWREGWGLRQTRNSNQAD